ncbi:MAG: hypothetical protein Q4B47_03355 [Eubacteriales bacterium]|nr:hypothetical protein [Eubacteriales bacterium]
MTDYITTYSGVHFYPMNPEPEMVRIQDIAHALSMICRGNGHVKTFLSVGQHCIRCAKEAQARGMSERVVLGCLLHDAGEAYMSDVPRPFKQYLQGYVEMEEKLLSMIYIKYLGSDLTEEEQKLLRQVDDDVLYYDLKILLNEPSEKTEPEMKVPFTYQFVPFEQIEKEYMEMFEKIHYNINNNSQSGGEK